VAAQIKKKYVFTHAIINEGMQCIYFGTGHKPTTQTMATADAT
jgi:hypothetical protein